MKLLVISDTHHNIENAVVLINRHKPDYVLHLGDMCEDCERLQDIFPNLLIISVIGNNNYKSSYPEYPLERVFELGGQKIFMCHGHKYHVKLGIFSLVLRAKELQADIVLFGHTHSKFIDTEEDMLIMNPGSVRSYGIIEITDGKVNARLENYDNE